MFFLFFSLKIIFLTSSFFYSFLLILYHLKFDEVFLGCIQLSICNNNNNPFISMSVCINKIPFLLLIRPENNVALIRLYSAKFLGGLFVLIFKFALIPNLIRCLSSSVNTGALLLGILDCFFGCLSNKLVKMELNKCIFSSTS